MPSRPLVYLTYGDVDSPVYSTQVIGFSDFLEQEVSIPVSVVAFVPLRMYFSQKKKLGQYGRKVKVLPVINRWQGKRWYARLNAWLISRMDAASVMTRNPVALHVCLALKEKGWKYFYDARGCNYKEMEEFSDASPDVIDAMKSYERGSWKSADWVFSVSQKLVDHFKNELRYRDHNHSIIPCCYVPTPLLEHGLSKSNLFGTEDVTVYCYAGALSVWNFPRAFLELTRSILDNEQNRLIILSHQLEALHPHRQFDSPRCLKLSVSHAEVSTYLSFTDHAILLRKRAVTNQVASPSKFADYLSNGCRVIISPEIGDLSDMVGAHDLGIVYRGKKDNGLIKAITKTTETDRERIRQFAEERFLRTSTLNLLKYRNLKMIHDGRTN